MRTYNVPKGNETYYNEDLISIEVFNSDNTRHITIRENANGEFVISTDKIISLDLHTNVINL